MSINNGKRRKARAKVVAEKGGAASGVDAEECGMSSISRGERSTDEANIASDLLSTLSGIDLIGCRG